MKKVEPVEAEKEDEEIECPICYVSLGPSLTILDGCTHTYCQECIPQINKYDGCPMCRAKFESTLMVDAPIKINSLKIQLLRHMKGNLPKEVTYFDNESSYYWRSLALCRRVEDQREPWKRYNKLNGTESMNLSKYKDNGRILMKNDKFLVIKTEEGYTQTIICYHVSNMVMRIVITDEKFDFETDDVAADEAVKCLDIQIKACWEVLPTLLGPTISRLFIRKFENVTCFLALFGFNDKKIPGPTPMKQEIRKIKKCNFDESLFKNLWGKIPPLDLKKIYDFIEL